MQELQFSDIAAVINRLDVPYADKARLREELLRQTGEEALRIVRANIAARINDSNGHVQVWQGSHIGDKLGYTAVRANKTELTGNNSRGAITNYLEHGHETRKPRASRRYKPRIRVARVPGRFFYRQSKQDFAPVAERIAKEFAERVVKEMGFR